MSSTKNRILLDWECGTNSGWGVLGLNIFAQWCEDPDLIPVMGQVVRGEHVAGIDPIRLRRMLPAMHRSNQQLKQIRESNPSDANPDLVSITALGNQFVPASITPAKLAIGRTIFEDTNFASDTHKLKSFDLLLAGSRWNADLIHAATGRMPHVIPEGIDPDVFFPRHEPRTTPDENFYVFSGGKVEHRKGQDLVLKVFKKFSEKYPRAVLVVCWQTLRPEMSLGMQGVLDYPLQIGANGMLDINRWALENGLAPNRVLDCGMVKHADMPNILRQMDVSIQLSRAEACTNLPVKESMACGVPVIAGFNTGMKDLLTDENSLVLRHQRAVHQYGTGTHGWGESDLDEAFVALEKAYLDREWLRSLGLRASAWIRQEGRTWPEHARLLKAWIQDSSGE